MRRGTLPPRWLPLGLCLCGALSVAHGQIHTDGSLRGTPQAPARLGAAPEFTLPPVPGSAPPAPSELLLDVGFQGNTVIATSELEALAAPWRNKRVDAADLEALRVDLTRLYVDRGYVNSGARLIGGGLQAGIARFELVEGRLDAVALSGMDGLAEDYLTARLLPHRDQVLNLNDLRERYQLLLDDPLVRRMNARLVPSARPGEARLEVEVQRAPAWQAQFALHNHRPPSIGETTLAIDLGVRNSTGRGDLLQFSGQQPVAEANSARAGLFWQVPLNFHGLQLKLQTERGDSAVVEEPLRVVGVSSRLDSRDVELSQRLWDRLSGGAGVGLVYQRRESRTWLGGEPFAFIAGEPEHGTRARTWRFWQDYSRRSAHEVLALRSTFAQTRDNLQALPAEANAQVAERAYGFWLGQGQYSRRFSDTGAQLTVRATVQAGRARMLSLDGLSIGGMGTVRGFRENQLIRDRGAIVNLEWGYPLLLAGAATLELAPFVDWGAGRNHGGPRDAIGAAGLALRWRWREFAADLALARRIHRSAGVELGHGALQDAGLQFHFSYRPGRE